MLTIAGVPWKSAFVRLASGVASGSSPAAFSAG
jgi:hypothetical protein